MTTPPPPEPVTREIVLSDGAAVVQIEVEIRDYLGLELKDRQLLAVLADLVHDDAPDLEATEPVEVGDLSAPEPIEELQTDVRHTHHWKLGAPTAEGTEGSCECGEQRVFPAEPANPMAQHRPKGSTGRGNAWLKFVEALPEDREYRSIKDMAGLTGLTDAGVRLHVERAVAEQKLESEQRDSPRRHKVYRRVEDA